MDIVGQRVNNLPALPINFWLKLDNSHILQEIIIVSGNQILRIETLSQ